MNLIEKYKKNCGMTQICNQLPSYIIWVLLRHIIAKTIKKVNRISVNKVNICIVIQGAVILFSISVYGLLHQTLFLMNTRLWIDPFFKLGVLHCTGQYTRSGVGVDLNTLFKKWGVYSNTVIH